MHRSQLAGFIIDCQTDDLDAAAGFWSGALGFAVRPSAANEDAGYALLDSESSGLHIEVQRVDHPSRVHLDIETDDIEAEVRRLEKLGRKTTAPGAQLVGHGSADGSAFLRRACAERELHADRATLEGLTRPLSSRSDPAATPGCACWPSASV